jgi:WS/DGAT/MGAT family acyltransferase
MQQISPQDAQFLYMESPNNLTHATLVSLFDPTTAPQGEVTFDDIAAHIKSRQDTSALFTRRLHHVPLELDYPYWVDDEHFDIDNHLRRSQLAAPGDWQQFCLEISRYHSSALDMRRPPWEMNIIEGLDRIDGLPANSYAIATKIHHVAVDGASVIKFLAALQDSDALGTRVVEPSTETRSTHKAPGVGDMIKRALSNNLVAPIRVTDVLLRSAPLVRRAARETLGALASGKSTVPETRFSGTVSPNKTVDATSFSLNDFKSISKLVDKAKINDVVLAVCSGGLRRYLQHHNDLPDDSLIAWVPINRRPGTSQVSTGEDPGNNLSAMTTAIHTNISDPLHRLRAIVRSTADSKEARSGTSVRLMADITRNVASSTQLAAAKLAVKTKFGSACNVFISNVPGDQEQRYMNGARIAGNLAIAPLSDGMGLFIGVLSYNGRISFTITSSRELLPDSERLVECLRAAYTELMFLADPEHSEKEKDQWF